MLPSVIYKQTRTIWIFLLLYITVNQIVGCRKLVEVEPPITSTNGENVYSDNNTAIAAITSIYANMSNSDVSLTTGWLTNIFFVTGLTGDELTLWNLGNETLLSYYNNNLSAQEYPTWSNIYKIIFICNSAIKGLNDARSLTPMVKQQLLGEVKFMRGFCYFYLVNLYGGVPLATTTDYEQNRNLARADENVVLDHVIADLMDAKGLLSEQYLEKDLINQTFERVRPTKWSALALLARAYLYKKDWANAISNSTLVIDNKALFELEPLDNVFLKNNSEAIWQLQPVGISGDLNGNTKEGQSLKLFEEGPNGFTNQVYLSDNLVQSFEINDQRKVNWIGNVKVGDVTYNYAYKYKIGLEDFPTSEYSTVLRLAEQYLIRAEAEIEMGKIIDGINDINVIRKRATDNSAAPNDQLSQLPITLNKSQALMAIEMERRHELFTEWGHRWFDLKRTGRIDATLGEIKAPFWQSTDQLYPIPQYDIDQNQNLRGHQNPGYN